MTSIVTGATGFIGNNLVRALAKRGERLIALSRQPILSYRNELVTWRSYPETVAAWDDILEEGSTVYHLAWSSLPQTSNENPIKDASDNILGSLHLLDAAKRKGKVRVVFASSGGTVYGPLKSVPASEQHDTRPLCAYGVSKLTIEKYLAFYHDLWGLDTMVLRISNAFGPGQTVNRNFGAISTFATRLAEGQPITIFGDGSVIRDYIYIDDLIEALITAGNRQGLSGIINIGSGVGKSLHDIVRLLERIYKKQIEINYFTRRTADVPVSVLDVSLADGILGWKPRTTFEVGVERTARAITENARQLKS
jgi:UDP-glucose 4-epimerase